MKTCETCRHWMFEEQDWEFENLNVGDCKRIKMREDVTSSDALGVSRWDDEKAWEVAAEGALRSAKAFTVDASSYYSALRTRPDFGCVLHEQRTPPTTEEEEP